MVKASFFCIAAAIILANFAESAQIPTKEEAKIIVILDIAQKDDTKIIVASEIPGKVDNVSSNSEIASREQPKIPVHVILSLDNQPASTQVKPLSTAAVDDEPATSDVRGGTIWVYVGAMGTKKYFYEIQHREYNSAKKACVKEGYDLVIISDQAEADFLADNTLSNSLMWTAGIGTLAFTWDDTNQFVTIPVNQDPNKAVRLQFDTRIDSLTRTQLIAKPNTSKAYPLCQLIVSP